MFSSVLFALACVMFIVAFISYWFNESKASTTNQQSHLIQSAQKNAPLLQNIMIKTATLEGEIQRLNTLSKVIADTQDIDVENYALSQPPAMGGRANHRITPVKPLSTQKIAQRIAALERELNQQEQRYHNFKSMNLDGANDNPLFGQPSSFNKTVDLPQSPYTGVVNYTNPVKKGFVSSPYGFRQDPFTGHRRHHNGIDIAAKHGSTIHSVANGFVSFAGWKGGYGYVIDIQHSASMKSRYAHLHKLNVKKGQVVRKGQAIATMGSSGRATGSHLHLEIWKHQRPVNPATYINTALIR